MFQDSAVTATKAGGHCRAGLAMLLCRRGAHIEHPRRRHKLVPCSLIGLSLIGVRGRGLDAVPIRLSNF